MFANRPPNFEKKSFFEQVSNSLILIVNQCENIIVTGNLNINLLDSISDTKNYFSDLRETFVLTNFVKDKTCFINKNGTLLDVILTNRPNCFQNTYISATDLSDCHKLVTTTFRSAFTKLPPKSVRYRSYKTFNKENFVHELDQKLVKGDISDSYFKLIEIFSHARTKSKTIRGNQAPFIDKELSKVIINKSRIENKY